jgi:hypothetical protein
MERTVAGPFPGIHLALVCAELIESSDIFVIHLIYLVPAEAAAIIFSELRVLLFPIASAIMTSLVHHILLEGNVFFGGRLSRDLLRRRSRFGGPSTKELNPFGIYTDLASFLTRLLIFPTVLLETTLDKRGTTFFEVFRAEFGGPAPGNNIDEGDFFLLFP